VVLANVLYNVSEAILADDPLDKAMMLKPIAAHVIYAHDAHRNRVEDVRALPRRCVEAV
jgi:hypothetical protein